MNKSQNSDAWSIFEKTNHPVWFMRQAGRYLPEYRLVRAKYLNFLDLCFNVDDVVKVSMQPLERFDLDACIVFSDILTIPHFLGARVVFDPKPRISPLSLCDAQKNFLLIQEKMKPVQEAITQLSCLTHKPVIGFCGAPATLAYYMKIQPLETEWIEILTQAAIGVLMCEIKSGAKMVQIFDSWAKLIPLENQEAWIKKPLEDIVTAVHEHYPGFPIVYYGRGISSLYKELSKLNIGFCVDETADMHSLLKELPTDTILQGNISPHALKEGGFEKHLEELVVLMQGKKHIFNLGQGILPQTPIENVERFLAILRGY